MVVLASFTQPTDGIRHRQNNTTVYVNDNNLGKGTLYIAESRLSWVSDSGSGFSIEYPHISLHAVSRDLSAFPQECLFLMLDTALGDENEKNGDGDDEDGNENGSDEQETTELRLVPDDRGMLDAMFHAMNACQALHPDPEDSFSDEDFYEDADDEIPVEETGSRMASLSIENMESRRYISGNEGGSVSGMEEDMEEDMEEVNILGNSILGGGMEAGRVGGRVVGREAGREVGREGGTEMDTREGRLGGVLDRFDIQENCMENRMVCMGPGMAQGDRSFSLGSTWHQGRRAQSPAARPHQTIPDEESNFADAEN